MIRISGLTLSQSDINVIIYRNLEISLNPDSNIKLLRNINIAELVLAVKHRRISVDFIGILIDSISQSISDV